MPVRFMCPVPCTLLYCGNYVLTCALSSSITVLFLLCLTCRTYWKETVHGVAVLGLVVCKRYYRMAFAFESGSGEVCSSPPVQAASWLFLCCAGASLHRDYRGWICSSTLLLCQIGWSWRCYQGSRGICISESHFLRTQAENNNVEVYRSGFVR